MTSFRPVKTALIGCGMISEIYLKNCCENYKILEVVGCSDLLPERSAAKARAFGIRQMTNEEIFSDPEIELIINTTYPLSHYPVSKAALLAGKNVYSEKMLAVTFAQGAELIQLAKEKGLLLGCAPDTFMGAALQTARRVIDSGFIGTPVAATAILGRCYHHERWKTEAERRFAFCEGGGILYDMGGYYLSGLIHLLGPMQRVAGISQTIGKDSRRFANPDNPAYGQKMSVDSPNNTVGIVEFQNGTLCSFLHSSESGGSHNSYCIFGTEGKLDLGDPNEFASAASPLKLTTKAGGEQIVPLTHAFTGNCRGLGAADLAYALRDRRLPRASGENALHILEAACAMEQSGLTGRFHTMTTSCSRPQPLESGYTEYPEQVLGRML